MIELRVLGNLDVSASGGSLRGQPLQPKRAALLAYLALARPRGFHRRDSVLAVFWPEQGDTGARDALNSSIHHLRARLGRDLIRSRGADEIALSPECLWCDALAFELAIMAGNREQALTLYRGDLLEGFHIGDAPAFEEWLDRERTRLRTLAAESAAHLSDESGRACDRANAVFWARRGVALAPDDERARRRLIAALDAGGDRAGALRSYEEFARWLKAEFDVEPAAETTALVESVRRRSTARGDTGGVQDLADTGRCDSQRAPAGPRRAPTRSKVVLAAGLATVAAAVLGVNTYARTGARRPVTVAADASTLAVLPFRVTSADSSFNYLREGIVDLLCAQLTGAGLPRAVDSRTTLHAWRSAARPDGRELTTAESIALASRLGASQLLLGEVVVTGGRKTISGRLLDVGSGKVVAEHSESGTADELILAHRMTGRLVARAIGEGAARLPMLSDSIAAVKAYLAGVRAFRVRDDAAADNHLRRALDIDSTFAVAALWRMLFDSGDIHERSQRAWRLRHLLGVRDRALLDAHFGIGPNYPATSTMRELLEASERAARLNPDRAEAWYDYGGYMLVHGPQAYDHSAVRAAKALDVAIALDSVFGPALHWRLEAALVQGNADEIRRYAALNAAVNTGEKAIVYSWLAARATNDAPALRRLASRMEEISEFLLVGWAIASVRHGLPMDDAQRALERRDARRKLTGRPRSMYLGTAFMMDVVRGRRRDALARVDSLPMFPPRSLAITAALADSLFAPAADAVAPSMDALADSGRSADAVCYSELWRVARNDTTNTRRAIATIRELVKDLPPAGYPRVGRFHVCPLLLAATLERRRSRIGPHPAVDSLERLLRSGPGLETPGNLATLAVARWRAEDGDYPVALDVIRRRPFIHHFYYTIVLPAHLREEGRLAALVGDTAGAIHAFEQYLDLRDRPDPGPLSAEVSSVRAQLAGLRPPHRRTAGVRRGRDHLRRESVH